MHLVHDRANRALRAILAHHQSPPAQKAALVRARTSFSNVMNPKPRDRCVWRSNMTTASLITPYLSKYNLKSASVTEGASPPTKIFLVSMGFITGAAALTLLAGAAERRTRRRV